MALNIKNEQTQRLSRELAQLAGESVTTAVTVAVRERLERLRAGEQTADERAERIMTLGRLIAEALPPERAKVEDLYDDVGLPA